MATCLTFGLTFACLSFAHLLIMLDQHVVASTLHVLLNALKRLHAREQYEICLNELIV